MREPSLQRTRLILGLRFLRNVLPWLVHLLAADLLLSALLFLAPIFHKRRYDIASRIAESVWCGVQHICLSNGAQITISGDELPHGESAVIVSNHVEWADFYLIQALAIRAGMLGRCRWFAKKQLKWIPFLGWGLWAMGMPLVSRRWTEDREEMARLFSGMKKECWPMWLISFSEATRYTRNKHLEAVRWCYAHKKPSPRHTLFPRTKGFVATVQSLRQSHVVACYDVTIAYARGQEFMSAPTFFETLYQPDLAQHYRMHADVRRYELKSLPQDDVELARWLEARWIEKGNRLEALRLQLANSESWAGGEFTKK